MNRIINFIVSVESHGSLRQYPCMTWTQAQHIKSMYTRQGHKVRIFDHDGWRGIDVEQAEEHKSAGYASQEYDR